MTLANRCLVWRHGSLTSYGLGMIASTWRAREAHLACVWCSSIRVSSSVITSTKKFFISEWSFLLSSNVRIKIRAGIWKILLHQCRDPGLNKSELHANITTMLWSNDNALLVWHIAPSGLTSHSVYRIYINSWMTYVCNKVLRNLIVSSNFESLPVGALRPSM